MNLSAEDLEKFGRYIELLAEIEAENKKEV